MAKIGHAENAENLDWAIISARVVLGGIFIWAGLAKLISLDYFIETVANFEIAPFDSAPWDMWLGYMLPALEVITGSCLILSIVYRGALISAALMSGGFLAAIISAHLRGLNIECGCFGKALTFDNYYTHIAILVGMCALAMYLIAAECRKTQPAQEVR